MSSYITLIGVAVAITVSTNRITPMAPRSDADSIEPLIAWSIASTVVLTVPADNAILHVHHKV